MKPHPFKNTLLVSSIAALLHALPAQHAKAQTGEDNPTGESGRFNGNVTTGVSYDPYTGNATRSVTDLVVPGAVGAYPLAFIRTMNSRYTPDSNAPALQFGDGGGWRHNYEWAIQSLTIVSSAQNKDTVMPSVYTVYFPDGRRVGFSDIANDGDNYFRGGPGVRERFEPATNTAGGGSCWLKLPDGGAVEFEMAIERSVINDGAGSVTSTFTYQVKKIIDPHGLATTIAGSAASGGVEIKEPAGRRLNLTYSGGLLTEVEEYRDATTTQVRRCVRYKYNSQLHPGFTVMNEVHYFFGDEYKAYYTYQPSNKSSTNPRPLIATADDPMFAGAMSRIAYVFKSGGAYGQLYQEKHLDGSLVSQLDFTGTNTRQETRGDMPLSPRTFTYADGYLQSWTDFKGVGASQAHTSGTKGYVSAYTNERGHTTDYQRNSKTGNVELVAHPPTPPDTQRATVRTIYSGGAGCDAGNQDANNPYYVCSVTNELEKTTTFIRDGVTKRVTQILHPDNSSESFVYNALGQVTRHQRRNGAYEHMVYDGRGRLLHRWNPIASPNTPDPAGPEAKTSFTYYEIGHPWDDRVWKMTDPRGHTTDYEYDRFRDGQPHAGRGQVTKITHPLTPPDTDRKYVTFGYDYPRGRPEWQENELRKRTTFSYDDYNRRTAVTNPLAQATKYDYKRPSTASSFLHTSSSPFAEELPSTKAVHFDYDPNFRKTKSVQAPNNQWERAETIFDYDPTGNLKTVQDPRLHTTTFGYDERNRRTSKTDPAPFTSQVTRWEYDRASNVRFETRPDTRRREMQYDAMNQVIDTYGFGNEHTIYRRDLAGRVYEMVDPKNAVYSFGYDRQDRKTSTIYPIDSEGAQRTEQWNYDGAGNLDYHKTAAGDEQYLVFDPRNRNTLSDWTIHYSSWGGQKIETTYDAVSRTTSIKTNNGETLLAYGYDDANRQIWEDQTVTGHPTRRVETVPNVDGNRDYLNVPSVPGFKLSYGYTDRNQLWSISDANGSHIYRYFYDRSGNITRRQGTYGGANDATDVPADQYDALNRPMQWSHTWRGGDDLLMRNWMQYDPVSRLKATWRDDNFSNRGDAYRYDPFDQLKTAYYNADYAWTDNPLNAKRTVTYDNDALNRIAVTDTIVGSGNGLTATYYDNVDLSGTSVRRTDSVIDWNWGSGSPDPAIAPDTFSARWEGKIVPRFTEPYTFYTRSDDGVRLWVDGQIVVNNWTDHGYTENSGSVYSLVAGREYDIRVEYYERGGGAALALLWSSSSQPKEVVPQSQLRTPSESGGYRHSDLNQYDEAAGRWLFHDAQFNVTDYDTARYTFDAANRLVRARSVNAATMENTYDALGRCLKRVTTGPSGSSTLIIAYDGWKPVVEWDGNNAFVAWNVYGPGPDEILMRNRAGAGYIRYKLDRMGNVIALLDATANNVLETYTYDAFGQPTIRDWTSTPNQDGPNPRWKSKYGNRFMFTGREYIAEFGIYDYRNRFYHPKLGRFLQADPAGFDAGDSNLFRYCAGDPVNCTDPMGLAAEVIPGTGSGIPVDINLKIRYMGGMFNQPIPAGAPAAFNNGITSILQGPVGPYTLRTNLGVGPTNHVTVERGNLSATVIGASSGHTWRVNASLSGAGYMAAHETLHILGLADLYIKNPNGTPKLGPDKLPQPIEGVDPNNIMVGRGGTKLEPWQVEQIIKLHNPSWFQRLFAWANPVGQAPVWQVAGYGSPDAYSAAKLSSAIQLWANSAMPSWMPFAQSDFATQFSTANGQRHEADGNGGANLVGPSR